MHFRGLLLSLTVAVNCLSLAARCGHAQSIDSRLWGVDGTVTAIARSGDTLYVGGAFSIAGPCTGGGVPIDASSGRPIEPYPRVAGSVFVSLPDGHGGRYVGGSFTGVGGLRRSGLAHIAADWSVADWAPRVGGSVGALVLKGGVLYVGGSFTTVNGQTRSNLAAFDLTTGNLLDWNPGANSTVCAMAAGADDTSLYVGGNFQFMGGLPRSFVASVGLSSGAVTAWEPHVGGTVMTLVVSGQTIYVGGYFTIVDGEGRGLIAALDATSGHVTAFNPNASGYRPNQYVPAPFVSAITLDGPRIYVGGNFTQIGGEPRASLAAIDAATGSALAWAPAIGLRLDGFPPLPVDVIVTHDSTVYVGGAFTTVDGTDRHGLAAFDATSGTLRPWNPHALGSVSCFDVDGTTVYAGGMFTSMCDWQPRSCLAAFDLTTGAATSWDPQVNGFGVDGIAVRGGTVYIGGFFSGINGTPRNCLAALDATTGGVLAWDPNHSWDPNSPTGGGIRALTASDSVLYVAGDFVNIGGAPRRNLAALDFVTAAATPWAPDPDDMVFSIASYQGKVYIGGFFTNVGGQARHQVAALDATTGAATSWNPGTNGIIQEFAVTDSAIYAAGSFTTIGGEARDGIACLSPETGSPSEWYPRISGSEVGYLTNFAVASCGGTVYLGGDFANVGSEARSCFAGIDAKSGLATPWDPASDHRVFTLASYGDTVYAGGSFTMMGGQPQSGLAAIIAPRRGTGQRPIAIGASSIEPNPCHTAAIVRFALARPGTASLAIYDLQGRQVARPLDHIQLQGGQQRVSVSTSTLKSGLYLCRLRTAEFESTRKMLVIR